MKFKIAFLSLLLFASVPGSRADDSSTAKIRQLNYNAQHDYLFFLTQGAWEIKAPDGTVSCNPTYIQVNPDVPGHEKLLSIGLAAKISGADVQFSGTCRADNPDYFLATYIVIR